MRPRGTTGDVWRGAPGKVSYRPSSSVLGAPTCLCVLSLALAAVVLCTMPYVAHRDSLAALPAVLPEPLAASGASQPAEATPDPGSVALGSRRKHPQESPQHMRLWVPLEGVPQHSSPGLS